MLQRGPSLDSFILIGKSHESSDNDQSANRSLPSHSNAGGGGERVLWQAVEYHLRQDPNIIVVIYSGDVDESASLVETKKGEFSPPTSGMMLPDRAQSATREDILQKCNARFGIPLHENKYSSRIWLLPLANRVMVSESYWKRMTLLGQSYGSMQLAFEACTQLLPDIWIDTMGYAFSYPVVRMFNSNIPVAGYVHYPVISTDMLERVKKRQAGHTNSSNVSSSAFRSQVKIIYYNIFAVLYSWALKRSDVLVANGSWTQNHLNKLVNGSKSHDATDRRFVKVVYPPCDTGSMSSFPLTGRDAFSMVSLAQFRPEKEHSTQLQIIAQLVKTRKQAGQRIEDINLCCMGSCRNEEDEKRIEGLKTLSKELDIEEHISFLINAPYSTILERLSTASIGLSTMVDEHFGINVVEFMAAGLITLSHASAGPLLDIAVASSSGQITGFHARKVDEFVDRLQMILSLEEAKQLAIRKEARDRAIQVFSNQAFCQSWETNLWSRLNRSVADKKSQ
jgi:alpha-1,2-mannosyltransferase